MKGLHASNSTVSLIFDCSQVKSSLVKSSRGYSPTRSRSMLSTHSHPLRNIVRIPTQPSEMKSLGKNIQSQTPPPPHLPFQNIYTQKKKKTTDSFIRPHSKQSTNIQTPHPIQTNHFQKHLHQFLKRTAKTLTKSKERKEKKIKEMERR